MADVEIRSPEYSSDDVARLTGVPYRTLMRWVERGLLMPLRDPAKQKGACRWTRQGVCEAHLVNQMSAHRVRLEQIRPIMVFLSYQQQNPFTATSFLWLKRSSVGVPGMELLRSEGRAMDLLRRGEAVLALVPPALAAEELEAPEPKLEVGPGGAPHAVSESGIVSHMGRLWLIGGLLDRSHWDMTFYQSIHAYDPVTEDWTEAARFPTPRAGAAAVVVGDRLYVIGGAARIAEYVVNYDVVDEFDLQTGLFQGAPRLPAPMAPCGAAAVSGSVWIIGHAYAAQDDHVFVLDPDARTWREGPAPPSGLLGGNLVAASDALWYVGGSRDDRAAGALMRLEHDGRWTDVGAPMPEPSREHGVCTDGLRLYVVAGMLRWFELTARVAAFDPETCRWQRLPDLPDGGRCKNACAVLDGRLYSVGGETWAYSPDNHVYRLNLEDPDAGWERI